MSKDNVKDSSNKTVSVVMPLYNAANTIRESINSVLRQTHSDFELIVVDDCSTDDGSKIVEDMARIDTRIKLIQLDRNGGAGVARNTAIEAADGKYIAFLDADDQWREDKLEIQLKAFKENQTALVCSGYVVVDQNYNKTGIRRPKEWITYDDLLKSNLIGCLTAIYDTDRVGKMYMPTIRKRQDYALWLNIVRTAGPAYCIHRELSQYYIQPNSISSNKLEMLRWNYKMFRDTQSYNPIVAAMLTLRNAVYKVISR